MGAARTDRTLTARIGNGLLLLSPVLFAIGFVLTAFADSGSALESLPRPIAMAAAAAAALQLSATLVLRSRVWGALVALVLLVAGTSPLLGITLGLIGFAVAGFSRWRRFSTAAVAEGVGVAVAVVFVIAAGRTITSPAFNLGDVARSGPDVSGSGVSEETPDIFLILLDGYPRTDILASWGYDNSWFTEALAKRGFDVATASHTNYPSTALVLATTFHMRHIDQIEVLANVPERLDVQRRALRTALEHPPVLDRLAELGYITVSAGRPADYITLNTNRYRDAGWLNEFEHQILARTALSGVTVPMILDARRGEVIDTIEALPDVARDPAATFMFAHVVNPHLPFLFDRDGDPPAIACAPCTFATHIDHSGMTRTDFLRAYADQVHHLNGLVLEAIDGVLEHAPDAAVIIFSDHGSRAERVPDDDWYATFFAARTPGHDNVFPDDARPIAIFPLLLGAYFGDEFPIPADRDFLVPRAVEMPLDIAPRADDT